MNKEETQKKKDELSQELAEVERKIEEIKSGDGDTAKLAGQLVKLDAEKEIITTRINKADKELREIRTAEIDAELAELDEEENELRNEINAEHSEIEQILTRCYGEEITKAFFQPGRGDNMQTLMKGGHTRRTLLDLRTEGKFNEIGTTVAILRKEKTNLA